MEHLLVVVVVKIVILSLELGLELKLKDETMSREEKMHLFCIIYKSLKHWNETMLDIRSKTKKLQRLFY